MNNIAPDTALIRLMGSGLEPHHPQAQSANPTSVCPDLSGLFYAEKNYLYDAKTTPAKKRTLINHFDCFLVGTFFIIGIYYAAYFDDNLRDGPRTSGHKARTPCSKLSTNPISSSPRIWINSQSPQ
jgi:hypothetical protein